LTLPYQAQEKMAGKTNSWLSGSVDEALRSALVNLSFTDFVNTALVTVAGHEGPLRMRVKRSADKDFKGCDAVPDGNM
jgi:hypothetical protein